MSLWPFGRKNQDSALPPEVEKIFGRVVQFIEDEKAQNETLPTPLRKIMEKNGHLDTLSGPGEFGRSSTNPIPVNGPLGQLIYLSHLMTDYGTPMAFHRIGSIDSVDAYELLSLDGKRWDILYLSLYYPRKSRMIPSGYERITENFNRHLFRGTNSVVNGFPVGVYQHALDCARRLIQVPAVDGALRVLDSIVPTRSSQEHIKDVQRIVLSANDSETSGDLLRRDGGEKIDRLCELMNGMFHYLKAELEKSASQQGTILGERFDRELTYILLYLASTLIFRIAKRENPTSASDRLAMAWLRDRAEAEDLPIGVVVGEYRNAFDRLRGIEFLNTNDEFLKTEGGMIIGNSLAGNKSSMVFGVIASDYLTAVVKPLSDVIQKLEF